MVDEMVDRLLDILADKLTERLSAGHKELYTAKELAERYGVSCATIRSKMAAGEFGELVSVGERTRLVPGDIVQAGILISNSEVGMGSVSVKPLIYRLVCTNGMVADVGVGKRHVGRINESVDGDFGIFRDETIEADDRAFLMKIEDTVRAAVDEARFNALVQKLRDAKEAPILPAAAPKVVELAAKEFNIRQNESEGILGHLIAGGDLSLYGLANAVTRHAQDVQSYDRSTELEATGYKIITMQPSLLKRWNEEVSIV